MSIQLPPNSTGTIVDTVTLGGEDREVVVIGGNAAVAEESSVKNTAPAETVYGLVTRPILRKDGETLSTANLGVSGVFTQTWQDGSQDGIVWVEASARADQISATGGFIIQESDDSADSNFTVTVAAGTTVINTLLSIRAPITRRYWRVQYTNGGTGQTSFRLTATATSIVPTSLAEADYNTDANDQTNLSMIGIALPGTAGPVAGGTTTNPVVIKSEGASVDSNNSTATPLGGSATFTGTLTDVTQQGSISIQVFADQNSATDGLSFEWSTDGGSNWDIKDQHSITANQGEQFVLPRVAESFRIVYINGGAAQGIFRLETILNPWPVSGEVEELDVDLDAKDLALTTRAVIAGETPGGAFVNVKVSTAGNFKIDVEELAGVAVSLDTGTRDTGTQRVTIATDDLVPISAASLPLPAGAATLGAQLPDGHNVTIDNASIVVTATALDIRTLTSTDIVSVLGSTAADAASPNPVVVGFVASSTEPAEMSTNGDTVKAWADRFGRLVVVKNFPSDVSAAAHGPVTLTKTTDTIEDVIAAPSAGQSIYVTRLSCSNTSATAVRIDISDGSTVRESMFLAADGGGYVTPFDPPWELTAATALRATLGAAVTDVRINAHFYIMPDSTA